MGRRLTRVLILVAHSVTARLYNAKALRPACFPRNETAFFMHWIRSWVDSKFRIESCAGDEILRPLPGILSQLPSHLSSSLVTTVTDLSWLYKWTQFVSLKNDVGLTKHKQSTRLH